MVMATSARRSWVVMVGADTACRLITVVALAAPEDCDILDICFSPQTLSLP